MFLGLGLGLGMTPAVAGGGKPIIPPYLDDPAATARGMVVNSVGPDHLTFTTDSTDPRRAYSVPAPPAGATVEFDVTTSGSLYFRLDDDTGFEAPGYIELLASPPLAAGTHHVNITIPSYTTQTVIGFLCVTSGVNVQITNWRVLAP